MAIVQASGKNPMTAFIVDFMEISAFDDSTAFPHMIPGLLEVAYT
jgi:hypothetical protein